MKIKKKAAKPGRAIKIIDLNIPALFWERYNSLARRWRELNAGADQVKESSDDLGILGAEPDGAKLLRDVHESST